MPALRPLLIVAMLATLPAQAQQRRPEPAKPPAITGTITSVTIQQRMIIRVPRLPVGRAATTGATTVAPPTPIRWVEKKADKCVPVTTLAAAAVTGSDSVDLLLNGGKRLRARFDTNCPALDFYSGFYVTMPKDGKICAARDSIRARSGGECQIRSFRALVPAK